MTYISNSSITRHDLDKASFSFSFNNLEAKSAMKTGKDISSELFSIGASKFNISIYPNGDEDSEFMSVFLCNEVSKACQKVKNRM